MTQQLALLKFGRPWKLQLVQEAQEIQLARWLPTTEANWLTPFMLGWMGMWFAAFPIVETSPRNSSRQPLVIGSFYAAPASRKA